MRILRRFVPLATSFFLASCGYGPIYNCRTGCADPNEYRDIFCECHKSSSIGPTPAPIAYGEPYLEFKDVFGGCTAFQAYRYIFNPRIKATEVKIGYKERDGSATGHFEYKWCPVPANAVTFSTGYNLGLLYDEPDCFYRDFFISDWREHRTGDPVLSGCVPITFSDAPRISEKSSPAEVFGSLDPVSQQYASLLHYRFATLFKEIVAKADNLIGPKSESPSSISEEITPSKRLDCASLCKADDIRCVKYFPPDAKKIESLRNNILGTKPDSHVSTMSILNIFGFKDDPCTRSDSRVDAASRVTNDGEVCAYSVILNEGDKNPISAFHIGKNVDGESIGDAAGASIMFNKPYAMPYMMFSSDDLQSDYGGRVLEIGADMDGVYINTTANSCVALGISK